VLDPIKSRQLWSKSGQPTQRTSFNCLFSGAKGSKMIYWNISYIT
jgi:hypothetical protein